MEQLRLVWLGLRKDESPQSILEQLGCFEQTTKGSGLATAIAGIYIYYLVHLFPDVIGDQASSER